MRQSIATLSLCLTLLPLAALAAEPARPQPATQQVAASNADIIRQALANGQPLQQAIRAALRAGRNSLDALQDAIQAGADAYAALGILGSQSPRQAAELTTRAVAQFKLDPARAVASVVPLLPRRQVAGFVAEVARAIPAQARQLADAAVAVVPALSRQINRAVNAAVPAVGASSNNPAPAAATTPPVSGSGGSPVASPN